jgi:GNAT superfamily N-acetyltransferase
VSRAGAGECLWTFFAQRPGGELKVILPNAATGKDAEFGELMKKRKAIVRNNLKRAVPASGTNKRLRPKLAEGGKLGVRAGTARDVPLILSLIHELAKYERLTHEFQADARDLRRHGFGREPYFRTLICTRGGKPIGFALYFFTYSTFLCRPTLYVEDLFVLPEERGKGAGKALLAAMARVAVRKQCGRMEWAVLDWNTSAIGFYHRIGAKIRKDWRLTRIAGADLRRLAQGH